MKKNNDVKKSCICDPILKTMELLYDHYFPEDDSVKKVNKEMKEWSDKKAIEFEEDFVDDAS